MGLPDCIECQELLAAAALAIESHIDAMTRVAFALQNNPSDLEEISELERLACRRQGIRADAVAHYRMHVLQHDARRALVMTAA
jgi:hypothetical protein